LQTPAPGKDIHLFYSDDFRENLGPAVPPTGNFSPGVTPPRIQKPDEHIVMKRQR
jgi:hypothetical protein